MVQKLCLVVFILFIVAGCGSAPATPTPEPAPSASPLPMAPATTVVAKLETEGGPMLLVWDGNQLRVENDGLLSNPLPRTPFTPKIFSFTAEIVDGEEARFIRVWADDLQCKQYAAYPATGKVDVWVDCPPL